MALLICYIATDIISYCCELCSFECKKRTLLFDHYKLAHNTQPTRDQLKPKTKQPVKKEQEIDSEDPITQEMEKIHNTQVNEDYSNHTKFAAPDQQEELDMKLFLTPASSNGSAAAAYVEAAAAATAVDVHDELPEHRPSITKDLQQYGTDQFNITANELSVGNEFIVMADGTVEEVMGNGTCFNGRINLKAIFVTILLISGVVIEYINAAEDGVTLENGLVLDNIMQVQQTSDAEQTVTMDMDVDDIIIEESVGNDLSISSLASISMGPETTVQSKGIVFS